MEMPVPLANLSERFYQKFGHDLVEELVAWLNQMDTNYQTDLRELNELNFARFDAKLEQRVAQLDAKLEQRVAHLDAKLEQRVAQLDAKLEQRIAEVRSDLRTELAELRADFRVALEAQTRMLLKWMLGFWVATVPALGGVIVVVQHFLFGGRP